MEGMFMRNRIIAALAIIVVALLPAVGHADEVYVYDPVHHNFVDTIDPAGQVTAMTYDSIDKQVVVASVESGQTMITRYSYDSSSHVVSQVGSMTETDMVTAMTYDPDGDPIITSTSNGQGTDYGATPPSYDTDNHGRVTTMTYDGTDRFAEAETDSSGRTTIYQYDNDKNMSLSSSSSIDTGGLVTSMTYDGMDHVIAAVEASGNTTIYQYDSGGSPLTIPSPPGRVTSMTYDATGLVTTVDAPGGNSTIYQYDSTGNSYTPLSDAAGRVTTTAYDSDGEVLFLAVVPLPPSCSMGLAMLAVMMGTRYFSKFRHVGAGSSI
jgi:YD repeat-containing protein